MQYRTGMSFLIALGFGVFGWFVVGISTDLFLHGSTTMTPVGIKASIVGGWFFALTAFAVAYHVIDY